MNKRRFNELINKANSIIGYAIDDIETLNPTDQYKILTSVAQSLFAAAANRQLINKETLLNV